MVRSSLDEDGVVRTDRLWRFGGVFRRPRPDVRDSDTWQSLRKIWTLPFGVIIGGLLMALQIAGGMGIQYPRTRRLASAVLGVVYSLFFPGLHPWRYRGTAHLCPIRELLRTVFLTLRLDRLLLYD